jgi:peptidoglycan hydrolase-like protein with peptidoglycan-binding domain
LQIFLNDLGFTIATSGSESPGKETQIYDAPVSAAVKRFQKAYVSQITSYGGGAPNGIFDGPTMEAANALIAP